MEYTFAILGETNRRAILSLLLGSERSVGELERELGLPQPSVSKHLKVLRHVGLVSFRRDGRQMFYRANADATRPLYEWTGIFQQYWRHQLTRVKERAERKTRS